MPTYKAPINDVEFLLNDVLKIERYGNISGFAEATPDLVSVILNEAGKFAEEVMQPLNQSGDAEGCSFDKGAVTTPKGFDQAYTQFVESGWGGISADPHYGGQGLPQVIGAIVNEFASSANMAFAMYPGLTHGAYTAISKHGTDEQKAFYLPKLVTGEWSGTMNLTESHCGTDLGLMRTKAEAQKDGSYKITGAKIFISAGEHDLTENIIHLVLARIEGAEEGIKGISLFVVPRNVIGDDGSVGENNNVTCGAVEEKMGIHGNSTCVMNYDGATGWLIGEEHKGMRAMFTMMNEARLGVGIQGLAISEVAYQNAVTYAKDRLQGRSLTGAKYPDKPADPILVHPDIRRTLLNIKSFNEAARAFILWSALKADVVHWGESEDEREAADDHMGLLMPVIKGVLTDTGFQNTVSAQQVFGGHGYIAEWGMEQFVRDARIAMIYEGANGVQALDLVGRKLPRHGGRALMSFFAQIDKDLARIKDNESLSFIYGPLKKGRDDLEKATMWFMANGMSNPDNAGAGSTDYMHMFGLVVLGLMWLQMAKSAQDKLDAGEGDADFMKNKLITGRHFMERLMPETAAHLARIESGCETMMSMASEAF
jgi:3-(methylsulfanyl)propanoyl-CoA dehydrogenase